METPITFDIRAWNNLSVLLAVVLLVFWIVAGTYMAGVYPGTVPHARRTLQKLEAEALKDVPDCDLLTSVSNDSQYINVQASSKLRSAMQACTSKQSTMSTTASTSVPFTKARSAKPPRSFSRASAEAFLFDVLPVSGGANVSGTSRDSVTSQCEAACADNPECDGYVLTRTSNGLGVTYATVQDNVETMDESNPWDAPAMQQTKRYDEFRCQPVSNIRRGTGIVSGNGVDRPLIELYFPGVKKPTTVVKRFQKTPYTSSAPPAVATSSDQTLAECAESCSADPSCTGFDFSRLDDRGCYMFSGKGTKSLLADTRFDHYARTP